MFNNGGYGYGHQELILVKPPQPPQISCIFVIFLTFFELFYVAQMIYFMDSIAIANANVGDVTLEVISSMY